jgi:DNA-binding NarL/FixJ family response regulator
VSKIRNNKPGTALTKREREVLQLIADGGDDISIGEELGLSRYTIHFHANNLLAKLDKPTRASAAVEALRQGLIK